MYEKDVSHEKYEKGANHEKDVNHERDETHVTHANYEKRVNYVNNAMTIVHPHLQISLTPTFDLQISVLIVLQLYLHIY
jgi:hypothetical protein